MIESLKKRKLMDVKGFDLLKFDARVVVEDYWLEVHTRTGSRPDDEWIEIMGGIKGEKGLHYHTGINKDASVRFVKRRGVLKGFSQTATNALTNDLLDAKSDTWGEGKFIDYVGVSSNKISRKVWVSRVQLVKRDQTTEFD